MADTQVNVSEKTNPSHMETINTVITPSNEAKWAALSEDGKKATSAEHNLTIMDAIKSHPKAIFWSAVISMSIVMEGYDTILIGNFFGYPTFQKKYGSYAGVTDGYQISAPWQIGLSDSSTIGTIIGAFINGYASARWGYKRVMIVSLAFMIGFIFIVFFAPNLTVLLIGEILCGIPWGVFATTGPAYASEVCPMALRGILTVYVNLCWAIGQFIAAGVLDGLVTDTSQWGYRIPFAIQWIWPAPLLILILFAPESPWWYVRSGRVEEAEKTIKRLSSKNDEEAKDTVAMMVHTIQVEKEIESGTSYLECFKGTNLRRTEICCIAFIGQIMSGSSFAYSPSYFFEQAGVAPSESYKLSLGGTAIAFLGTCLSWILMAKFGRRTIYVGGIATLTVILLLIGFLSLSHASGVDWAQAAITLIWLGVYSLTLGPVAYCIVAETSAIRLRAKTVCLARNAYQVANIISNVIEPYMMNPTEWNWKGHTAFFWAGSAAIITVWSYFRLPEAKDRTYEELDILFAKKVSARRFKAYQVDAYSEEIAQEIHLLPGKSEM